MSDTLAALEQARQARERGEFDQALRLNIALHSAPLPESHRECASRAFAVFEWRMLGEVYPPALTALRVFRDQQAARLEDDPEHIFTWLDEVNRQLPDPHHTLQLFLSLEARLPDVAQRMFHAAADVLLACGAADVLQRYLPEPLDGMRYRAQYLDSVANDRSQARRLGEALAFVGDLQLQCGLLALRGKREEAETLQTWAPSLIEAAEARELVLRELAQPGTIADLLADWQAAQP